ncbi:MAG: hypothetical protein QF662_08200, partial [Phycisphaerae bacterium]|nr:hypothetical protein [Phycisphaerae bacterium]
LQAKIDQLVKDLSDEDYEAREEATKALMEIGLPALKAVKEASAKADIDPEITYRSEKILKAIRLGIGADWPPEMALLCRHFDTLTPGEQSAALRRIISWGKQRTISFLLTVLEKHQSDSTGREAMSSLFQFINDGEGFAENVLDVLEKPETPQQARLASHALRKLGRFSEAIDLIAKQDEIPRDEIARAVIEISRDLLGRDDYKEVEKLLQQHNKLLPDNDTRVAYLQAEALDHLNRSDDAQQLRLQALAMDVTENQRFLTADMLEQIGRPHLAGLEWQKTLDMAALGPIYKINAYLRLGSLSALLGWPHKGADYLEKGLEAFRKAKDDGFGITGASEEDIEDHIAELREKPKKEPSDGVEIKVVFKKDGYANYQEDLRDADFRVRLSVKPHGLRLLDQAKIEVVYDPEKSKLHVKLDSSDAATPIDVEKFDEPIIFILAQ